MAAEALTVVPGFQQYFGSKLKMVCEVTGPASYLAGGQTITNTSLGWGGFDVVAVPMRSLSGTYRCEVQPLPIDATPSVPLGAFQTFKIVWIVVATGAEVADAVDLSAEVVRFDALGI